ncbi:MAG: helix-turn-helix transcriptional regulator [Tractidigestivibacter sp.]|jgi:predicted DNA-binding transcriptional regulator YafY|uniref:helix-turn-helix transcriptional regulator n=1 Tax=Tractidigestivibacter sp. TaxID=2847320 RepID=UPI003D90BBE8
MAEETHIDDGFSELTDDDEKSRRVASIALAFMNASTLSDDEIWHTYYEELDKRDSYRVAFKRDRATLAACGIVLERAHLADGSNAWHVNEKLSFANTSELSDQDALVIDIACLPLVDDPNFPYGDELRLALAKIDDVFDNEAIESLKPSVRTPDKVLNIVRGCLDAGTAVQIQYTDASGEASKRVVAPYGIFGLRDKKYLVAPRIDERGDIASGSMRRYRLDRISSAKQLPKITFELPDDFDVQDWISLPFQIGQTICKGSFLVPQSRQKELERDLDRLGKEAGELEHDHDRVIWHVNVSNIDAAASWAISEQLRPLDPPNLVESYRTLLKGVIQNG